MEILFIVILLDSFFNKIHRRSRSATLRFVWPHVESDFSLLFWVLLSMLAISPTSTGQTLLGRLEFPSPDEASMTELDHLQRCAKASPQVSRAHISPGATKEFACVCDVKFTALLYPINLNIHQTLLQLVFPENFFFVPNRSFTSRFINISTVCFNICEREKSQRKIFL